MERRKTEFVRGIIMCFIMVFGMNLFETVLHLGALNINVFIESFNTFIFVFIAAYIIQNLVVGKAKDYIIKTFLKEEKSSLAFMLFNAVFIVTFMSMIMTVIGGIIGGESFADVLNNYFNVWPRNFCMAFFLNILVASPVCNYLSGKLRNLNNLNAENAE
ncbi:hypothetical protein [Anaerofustis sp. NSJ-163]|uniref:hypothetical protein n=1 Tax=Anaerofustis sp. NSJ-163 TaxID=2944391 RepID=UPI00209C69A8|nr:hypothetical protein [Anaerofustis sp. NSJ-163]MCO8193748.1 hypothetical protein [Anaerofustis sp. NSJ-163]